MTGFSLRRSGNPFARGLHEEFAGLHAEEGEGLPGSQARQADVRRLAGTNAQGKVAGLVLASARSIAHQQRLGLRAHRGSSQRIEMGSRVWPVTTVMLRRTSR